MGSYNCLLKKQNQNTTQTGIGFAKPPTGTRQTDFAEKMIVFYEQKAKGLIPRSKTCWTEWGEKPKKYLFNPEKRNYNRKKWYNFRTENIYPEPAK